MNLRLGTTILLALAHFAAHPLVAEGRKWTFFAMDTAVRDLANLAKAKELGYEGVGWRFEPAETMAESVAKVRDSGLPLVAVYGGATLTKEGIGFKGDLEARFAALAGTGTVLWLPVNSSDFAASDPAGDAVAVPELRRLADHAAKHGLRVALYPHVGSWIERVQDAVRVAKQVERPNFGVTFNLCHCLRVGDEAKIPALLAEAAPHLFLVTVNGADRNAAGAPWDRLIRPLDKGDFSVPGLLAELEKIGYSGPIGLQAFGVKIPVPENLERSIQAWRAMAPSGKESPRA
jgi:sugar phosphate isomerase/epimerase